MNVTITGADDKVDPNNLLALSREFPSVEWGILYSAKRQGTPRYPTERWINLLTSIPDMKLSLHLCGEASRTTLAGDDTWLVERPWFARIQVNGYASPATALVALAKTLPSFEFILQVRSEDRLQEAAHDAAQMPKASLLFDASGGRGIEPARWAVAPFGTKMGYAGGIKPANVSDVLADIGPVDESAWVDMESGVRDADDQFDLGLVREVLEKVAKVRG
jgi:hypothetical protein